MIRIAIAYQYRQPNLTHRMDATRKPAPNRLMPGGKRPHGANEEKPMLLPHGTLIALVDARKFELLRNNGTEAEPELVAIDTPKLDSHNHSGGSHHDGSTAVLSEDAHAIAAVEWLNHEVLAHRVTHVVVIATPRTLGELRKHYHKSLSHALIGELAKDLTGHKGPEVLAALRAK